MTSSRLYNDYMKTGLPKAYATIHTLNTPNMLEMAVFGVVLMADDGRTIKIESRPSEITRWLRPLLPLRRTQPTDVR